MNGMYISFRGIFKLFLYKNLVTSAVAKQFQSGRTGVPEQLKQSNNFNRVGCMCRIPYIRPRQCKNFYMLALLWRTRFNASNQKSQFFFWKMCFILGLAMDALVGRAAGRTGVILADAVEFAAHQRQGRARQHPVHLRLLCTHKTNNNQWRFLPWWSR